MSRVVVVCQARMGSQRLKGKVLLPLSGQPLLVRCVERIKRASTVSQVVVASTIEESDDELVKICGEKGLSVMRGHTTDLLDRHVKAAVMYNAEVVVKIPSDCPLIDPAVIDLTIDYYLNNADKFDYVSNLHPATWPDGNDVEVFSIDALHKAHRNATKQFEREHTTPWFWNANPAIRCGNVEWATGQNFSMKHRWTIDYPEDYMMIKAVYDALYSNDSAFTLEHILQFLEMHPEVHAANAHLIGVNWYRNHMHELHSIPASSTRPYPFPLQQ
jgi:spore coat polysaccharide biosynthesis protein SpsF